MSFRLLSPEKSRYSTIPTYEVDVPYSNPPWYCNEPRPWVNIPALKIEVDIAPGSVNVVMSVISMIETVLPPESRS